jgi:hypothetical protein
VGISEKSTRSRRSAKASRAGGKWIEGESSTRARVTHRSDSTGPRSSAEVDTPPQMKAAPGEARSCGSVLRDNIKHLTTGPSISFSAG